MSAIRRKPANKTRAGTAVSVHVSYACGRRGCPPRRLLQRWAEAALGKVKRATDLGIHVVDEKESAALNRRWRGHDRPANVLAFPHPDLAHVARRQLGDVVICGPVVAREASNQGKDTQAHWAHLVVHGTLHLLGYDHEKRPDARVMEALEKRILRHLAYPDPYE